MHTPSSHPPKFSPVRFKRVNAKQTPKIEQGQRGLWEVRSQSPRWVHRVPSGWHPELIRLSCDMWHGSNDPCGGRVIMFVIQENHAVFISRPFLAEWHIGYIIYFDLSFFYRSGKQSFKMFSMKCQIIYDVHCMTHNHKEFRTELSIKQLTHNESNSWMSSGILYIYIVKQLNPGTRCKTAAFE